MSSNFAFWVVDKEGKMVPDTFIDFRLEEIADKELEMDICYSSEIFYDTKADDSCC